MARQIPLEQTEYVRTWLDGCGSFLKHPFVQAVQREGRIFHTAFEWCSGIGEIGMTLLRKNLCERLVLADINSTAIDIAKQIAERDNLTSRIDFYVGDNLSPIPKTYKFDLVVGNPPNYFNIQKSHPLGARFFNDLRANDREWKIHKKFYAGIKEYLTDDAVIILHEVDPYKDKVTLDYNVPYDIRAEAPMLSFIRMAERGGLKIVDQWVMKQLGGVSMYGLKIVLDNAKNSGLKALATPMANPPQG